MNKVRIADFIDGIGDGIHDPLYSRWRIFY